MPCHHCHHHCAPMTMTMAQWHHLCHQNDNNISKFQILCTLMYNGVQMSQHYGKVPPCAGHITAATGCTAD